MAEGGPKADGPRPIGLRPTRGRGGRAGPKADGPRPIGEGGRRGTIDRSPVGPRDGGRGVHVDSTSDREGEGASDGRRRVRAPAGRRAGAGGRRAPAAGGGEAESVRRRGLKREGVATADDGVSRRRPRLHGNGAREKDGGTTAAPGGELRRYPTRYAERKRKGRGEREVYRGGAASRGRKRCGRGAAPGRGRGRRRWRPKLLRELSAAATSVAAAAGRGRAREAAMAAGRRRRRNAAERGGGFL